MTPQLEKLPAFSAICYRFDPPEEPFDVLDNGAYWLGQDFSSVSREDYARLTYPGYGDIGVWRHPDEASEKLCYYFGPAVQRKTFVPEGMEVLDFTGGDYAVFVLDAKCSPRELHDRINDAWKKIFSQWLETGGCTYDETRMNFECYRGVKVYLCVPVL